MKMKKIAKVVNPANGKIHDAVHFFDFGQGTSFALIPIREGTYLDKNRGLLLTNINADVFFEGRKIHLTDGEAVSNGMKLAGDILIDLGPPESHKFDLDMKRAKLFFAKNEYSANANIHFDNIEEPLGDFDIKINNSSGEMMRLAGNIKGVEIIFDNVLTHYTNIRPNELRLTMNNEKADLKIGMIDDQLSIAGHLSPRDGRLYFYDISYEYDKALSLLLDGEIRFPECVVEAQAKEVKLDLSKMNVFEACKPFADSWHPEGLLAGKGKIRFETKEEAPGWRSEAILNVSLKDWGMLNISLADAHDVSCHFITDKSVTYRNIISGFKSKTDDNVYGKFKLDMTSFDFDKNLLILDDLHFNIPSKNLNMLANDLAASFPEMFVPAVVETISEAKSTENFSGIVSIINDSRDTSIKLALDEGIYQFMGAEHPLKDFVLLLDKNILKMTSKYRYENHQFDIEAISHSPTLEEGDLILTGSKDRNEILNIAWKKDPVRGFEINHAQGEFSGLHVDLALDETNAGDQAEFLLIGTVRVDGKRAANLFSDEMRQKLISWSVGNGYLLKGNWFVLHDLASSGKVRFSGLLLGKDFELAGYQFDTLMAKLEYSPTYISIKDFKISDEAGTFSADKIQMGLNEDYWYFSVPELLVTKLRPSALRLLGMYRPTALRPLFVKELELKDFQGKISDPTSYTGEGQLVFTNRSKNPLQNTIFDVPAEILARIGLDMAVMTPVTGSILYDINNGFIYLKKFKDMFSERKLSKFYLSNHHISTVDFEGNLNLQIRMKQYNLLFKLTEPFAVNIMGPFSNPTYRVNAEGKKNPDFN
jgi:hypothetical protein